MSDLATHLLRLDGHLARFRDKGIPNLIGGQGSLGSGGVFATHSPVDESLIAKVARGTAADIDAAAKAAFPAWAAMSGAARKAILLRIAT